MKSYVSKNQASRFVAGFVAAMAVVVAAPPVVQARTEKFIPTFTIKYCSPSAGLLSPEETARFDLLVVSSSHYQSWSENGLNSWRTLKQYNPDIIIVLYHLGPSEYNTATWGEMGQGWDWMKANHGADAGTN